MFGEKLKLKSKKGKQMHWDYNANHMIKMFYINSIRPNKRQYNK